METFRTIIAAQSTAFGKKQKIGMELQTSQCLEHKNPPFGAAEQDKKNRGLMKSHINQRELSFVIAFTLIDGSCFMA